MKPKLLFRIILLVLLFISSSSIYSKVYSSNDGLSLLSNNTFIKGEAKTELSTNIVSKLLYSSPSPRDFKNNINEFVSVNSLLMPKACCPEFILKDAVDICPPDGACHQSSSPAGNTGGKSLAACKNTAHTYTVYPNDPTFTYTWTITGGSPLSFTGNPIIIVWGGGSSGSIKVVMSNIGVGGSCLDSLTMDVCLIDGPKAKFLTSKDTVCKNTPVHFTNISLGGSVYHWDFGDGTSSNLANPPDHSYALPGTYKVLLTAQDMGSGQVIPGTQGDGQIVPCGCTDTISKFIVVLSGDGPVINYDCCFGTVCAGDTSSFCTTMACGSYSWSVTGGTIISGVGTSCIKIKWNSVYTVPTTVTLQACATSTCPGATTLNVPVLYPNLPISGPTTICVGASGSYSLPWLPGTYYKWTVSGGLYSFNKTDRNTTSVNITFNTPGPFWVKCIYTNPMIGCNGADSVLVNVLPVFSINGTQTVCEGNPVYYFASGAANWTISPSGPTIISGNGTSTVLVSFTPGSYTITATPLSPATYCNTNAIFKVNAIAKPILGSVNGPANACPGSNLIYSITSNVSGSQYVWAISGGTGNIASQMGADNDSVVVNFTGLGPWILTVYQEIEITPGVFCQSLPKSILVNPFIPPLITGTSTVCANSTGTYTAGVSTPPGGYQWTISPSYQGTILSQVGNSVIILWHGPANIATLSVTSCAGNDFFPVTINAPPAAVASYNMLPIFCQGASQTLILSTPIVAGCSYQWYKNGSPVPLATSSSLNVSIAPLAIGTYQYYVVVTLNGCSITSNIINVRIDDCTVGTNGGGPNPGSCDALAFFKTYVVCGNITLLNLSSVVAPSTITNYSWSITGPGTGTFTPNANVATPGLSVNASGNYTITLTVTSSSGCVTTWTQIVTVLLPTANFTFTSPLCVNSIATFTPIPNLPSLNYAWNYGDGATTYYGPAITQHAYTTASPPPYNVSLMIIDAYGCTASVIKPVVVNPLPSCTISASDTIFCPGGNVTLFGCTGMSSYQWYKNGNPISGATLINYIANTIGEYWCSVTNGVGCANTTNHIYIYIHTLPKAHIIGSHYVCALPSGVATLNLSTLFDANYTYNWISIPAGAIFSPTNANATSINITMPLVLPVTYQFIVTVTDVTTGCINSDTMCVTFFETPVLSVTNLNACQGTSVTLTPSLINTTKYKYQWTNGATTPVITAINPGFYAVTITNKATGCSATANAGTINPKPDLSLFPLGCKSLCGNDTLYMYIPLPLNAIAPNNTYASAYPIIKWYDNGNYVTPIGTGQNINYPLPHTGTHQISVVVTNSFGCTDSMGVFCAKYACCLIALDSVHTHDALCTQSTDGGFTIYLSPTSVGGPFYITTAPLIPNLPGTITPGVPYVVSNLAPGTYSFTIASASGACNLHYDVIIKYTKLNCCFAETDTLFHKITSNITLTGNVVWDGKYYIADNVIVTMSGGTLDITTMDVVFGKCAGIDFVNGGHLRATNSVFRPCNIDGTWRGLRFVGNGQFSNIINTSTFKNAEVALYFQNQSDGVVSDNLFSNCNYGVRIENNNTFNHPISGNQFLTEQFLPMFTGCYSFVNNSSSYGIYAIASRLLQQVSQNGFVNTKGTSNPQTYGIYQVKSGGLFSANTFTDQFYSIYLNTPVYPSTIENNIIEVNLAAVNPPSSIYVNNSNIAVVEINNNQIANNFHVFNSNSGIYSQFSSNISIVNNKINGFHYGIIATNAKNYQISYNTITDADVNGIYFYGISTIKNYITCNTINMRNYNATTGLYSIDLSTLSEVSSNCIFDCNTSMDLRSFTVPNFPKVRNNYLYNYNKIGINDFGYGGNIGTLVPADPGLNTLWSNYNTAIDINSNTNIVVADNFGMFNISFPQVQIVSNRPYNSTAACGQQIYNMPSQGNLNIKYTCDNYAGMIGALNGTAATAFLLQPNYSNTLQTSTTQFDDANMILACVENPSISLLNEMLNLNTLTENDKAILKYNYYYKKADYTNAGISLSNFNPKTAEDDNYKFLRALDLDIITNGFKPFDAATLQRLNDIMINKNVNSNFAISILNNSSSYREHIFDIPQVTSPSASSNIQHISSDQASITIIPNPATDVVYIEVLQSNLLNGIVQIFDMNGKQVNNFKLNSVAGGFEMDIRNLKKGIYFVTLTDQNYGSIKTAKLIKD